MGNAAAPVTVANVVDDFFMGYTCTLFVNIMVSLNDCRFEGDLSFVFGIYTLDYFCNVGMVEITDDFHPFPPILEVKYFIILNKPHSLQRFQISFSLELSQKLSHSLNSSSLMQQRYDGNPLFN